ncbi:hypothetical protein PVAG01_04275 [Phlyctema vagabunda]|uniref:N-acetyltransferase domain-containing protein n=1 Tax=Phlyctema vagabunda TaxID=108571 RepID=A0ABR4PNT2_9HELO
MNTMKKYIYESYLRPGLNWSLDTRQKVSHELRGIAKICLGSVPEYQCLSNSRAAFDNNILIIAREKQSNKAVAFTSGLLLEIDDTIGTIFHTGLSCVLPEAQRQGLSHVLFGEVALRLFTAYPNGIWFTNLACLPSSLGNISLAAHNMFPSPRMTAPTDTHLRIARAISTSHRADMLISEKATLDPTTFVFHNSNPQDSPFCKTPGDPKIQHRQPRFNDFYNQLLGETPGNEVLQVGFCNPFTWLLICTISLKDPRYLHLLLVNATVYLRNRLVRNIRSLYWISAFVIVLLLFYSIYLTSLE